MSISKIPEAKDINKVVRLVTDLYNEFGFDDKVEVRPLGDDM